VSDEQPAASESSVTDTPNIRASLAYGNNHTIPG
jgi:hypothetical protein